jgi:serine/threonine protein kinase
MKMVKKTSVSSARQKIEQVIRERDILSKLSHPFIVHLHTAFVTRNFYCLVLDLCAGGELFYYTSKSRGFPVSRAKVLFAEVLLVFEYLHHN